MEHVRGHERAICSGEHTLPRQYVNMLRTPGTSFIFLLGVRPVIDFWPCPWYTVTNGSVTGVNERLSEIRIDRVGMLTHGRPGALHSQGKSKGTARAGMVSP
jgi:hypothetical protein